MDAAWYVARMALLLGVLLVSSVQTPPANAVDYDSLALECIVGAADAIVLARVDRDTAGEYWFEVREVVSGERLAGRTRIRMLPWEGPPARRTPGTALLFLRRPPRETTLYPVGPSNEGWFPVEGEVVRPVGVSMRGELWMSVPPQPLRLELAPLMNALRGLERCVGWNRDPLHGKVRATIVCDEIHLQALRRQSPLAEYLVAAALRARSEDGLPCLAVVGRPHPPFE